MEEKVLNNKKNGMTVLLVCIGLMLLGVVLAICSGINENLFQLIVGMILLSVSWIPLCGLRILRPQEALV